MQNEFDVIIIGAGATGLVAGLELALTGKKVLIIEAKDRTGGRIYTINNEETPIELGAEFVHGDLEQTRGLLKKANAELFELKGDIWRKEGTELHNSDFIEDYSLLQKKFKELDHDIPVKEFFEQYLNDQRDEELRKSLKNYVEGYYAADISFASTFALRDELQNSSDRQYRIEQGYETLIAYFQKEIIEKGCSVVLSSPVKEIRWQNEMVEAITETKTYRAKKCLVTVSLGVLQAGVIRFSPALPVHQKAAKALGFGPVVKVILLFRNAFWKNKTLTKEKNLSNMGFLFSEEDIPTWWTAYPKETAMITGWLGGPNAAKLKSSSSEEILDVALQSLSKIFEVTQSFLTNELIEHYYYNWMADPYTLGAYSFETVDSAQHKQFLKQPVDNTIFFAGEGLHEGPEIGTVEAALNSGREMAHKVVASF